MILEQNPQLILRRQGRYLAAELRRPHRVLSTCRINGGLREDLTHIVNHQSCEGVIDSARADLLIRLGSDAYHAYACEEAGTPAAATALMSTAANMQCAVVAHAEHAELRVTVAATAGVLGNATRAGDPAGWHETASGHERAVASPSCETTEVPAAEVGHGTIVLLVFINQPCPPACLVRAATLVTEGKSTALLDLRMPSLQSPGLATGTGTDQLAIAAPLAGETEWCRHWAGSHNTLGEMLGQATHAAVTRCLLLQNGVCAELRRSVCGALDRHGCNAAMLCAWAEQELGEPQAAQFAANLTALSHDPQSAAAAYCLAEAIDLAHTGVLHAEAAQEAVLNQAALLAASVAVQPEQFTAFRQRLQARQALPPGELAAVAMVQGFAAKWTT